MLIIISPAKTLDFNPLVIDCPHTTPDFLAESEQLVDILRQFSIEDIGQFMSISPKLAELNIRRFINWHRPFTADNAKQAIYAFKGDVYSGLDAPSLSVDDVNWAQDHLRILSGLYGLLRPLDLMQAYRLEMGRSLKTARGDNLYHFWKEQITNALNQHLKTINSNFLVNLASNEYSASVDLANINAKVITPVFKDWKNDRFKIISFFAKKARGMMSAWVIKNRIENAADLTNFDSDGYYFEPRESTLTAPVFHRKTT